MFLQAIKAAMVAQRAACSDQSQGEPGTKRAKKASMTETSTTVEKTTVCSVPEKAEAAMEVEAFEVEKPSADCCNEQQVEIIEPTESLSKEPQDSGCSNCTMMSNTMRKLKNRIVSLEAMVKRWKATNRRSNYRIKSEYSVCYFVMYQLMYFVVKFNNNNNNNNNNNKLY